MVIWISKKMEMKVSDKEIIKESDDPYEELRSGEKILGNCMYKILIPLDRLYYYANNISDILSGDLESCDEDDEPKMIVDLFETIALWQHHMYDLRKLSNLIDLAIPKLKNTFKDNYGSLAPFPSIKFHKEMGQSESHKLLVKQLMEEDRMAVMDQNFEGDENE
jgi:hypothetical protein